MFDMIYTYTDQVKKMCPNDPDATKKLKECEKAVMKLKFEEAIAVPGSVKRPIAESIDFRSIGTILNMFLMLISLFYIYFSSSKPPSFCGPLFCCK